ncbi:hypothetical protein [Noviherbaspirillum denitrificans]|uniref:hypothetical protein n=1 Tax=Noviherbaspirillum denitrificans TaxID=1968433 RepID=UPI001131CBBC|nr:hypothetical protein [Noviherbaspirillum denitrificans]
MKKPPKDESEGGCGFLQEEFLKFPPYYVVQKSAKNLFEEMPEFQRCKEIVPADALSPMAKSGGRGCRGRP